MQKWQLHQFCMKYVILTNSLDQCQDVAYILATIALLTPTGSPQSEDGNSCSSTSSSHQPAALSSSGLFWPWAEPACPQCLCWAPGNSNRNAASHSAPDLLEYNQADSESQWYTLGMSPGNSSAIILFDKGWPDMLIISPGEKMVLCIMSLHSLGFYQVSFLPWTQFSWTHSSLTPSSLPSHRASRLRFSFSTQVPLLKWNLQKISESIDLL